MCPKLWICDVISLSGKKSDFKFKNWRYRSVHSLIWGHAVTLLNPPRRNFIMWWEKLSIQVSSDFFLQNFNIDLIGDWGFCKLHLCYGLRLCFLNVLPLVKCSSENLGMGFKDVVGFFVVNHLLMGLNCFNFLCGVGYAGWRQARFCTLVRDIFLCLATLSVLLGCIMLIHKTITFFFIYFTRKMTFLK